jgi:hypothetical protein
MPELRRTSILRTTAFVVTMLTVFAIARTAGADDEDPDAIEAHCTLAEQCLSGTECRGDGYDRSSLETCETGQREVGHELRCGRAPKMTLWCPPGTHGSWKPHHTFLGISCAASPAAGAGLGGAGAWGLGALALVVVSARRARRRCRMALA